MSHCFEDLTSVTPNLRRMDFDNSDSTQYAKQVAKELASNILVDAGPCTAPAGDDRFDRIRGECDGTRGGK